MLGVLQALRGMAREPHQRSAQRTGPEAISQRPESIGSADRRGSGASQRAADCVTVLGVAWSGYDAGPVAAADAALLTCAITPLER